MSLESQFRQNLEDLDGRIHSILEHLEIAKGAKTRTAELAMEALHGVRKGTKVLVDGITFEVVQVLTRGSGGLCLPLEDLDPANVGQKPWIKVQAGLYMHLIEPSRWTLPPKEGKTP
jgi:hypothetical protein